MHRQLIEVCYTIHPHFSKQELPKPDAPGRQHEQNTASPTDCYNLRLALARLKQTAGTYGTYNSCPSSKDIRNIQPKVNAFMAGDDSNAKPSSAGSSSKFAVKAVTKTLLYQG